MTHDLVTVVIALFNPSPGYLSQQLQSIDNQTYRNIEVLAIDDCSTEIQFSTLEQIFSEHMNKVSYELKRNDENMGSNATFQKLTSLAQGNFIAFCDQDDIWKAHKIETLIHKIKQDKASMGFSDFSVIDRKGIEIAPSATKHYKRYVFYVGKNTAKYLLTKNFIPGCTSIIDASMAKSALPFVENMVHDHWLALYCATFGKISFVPESLTQYRIHEYNQTGVLKSVFSKKDYIRIRVEDEYRRFKELSERLSEIPGIRSHVKKLFIWVKARLDYYNGNLLSAFTILRYMHYNPYLSLFDLLALKLPESIFSRIIHLIRNRML